MELIRKYQEQYSEFCKIDDFNLEERAKRVPAEKHFWVARLIEAKIEKGSLVKQRSRAIRHQTERISESNSLVKLNAKELEKQLKESPTIESIDEKIKEQDFLIEYLDLLVRQVTFIAQDIKNIVEIRKLEETG